MQHLSSSTLFEINDAFDAHDRLVTDLLDIEDVGHRTRPSRRSAQLLGPFEAELATDFTSISTAPEVAVLTSSAKRLAFTVWKLPSGHTVASGSFSAACACTTAGAPSIATPAPTPAFKAFLRPSVMTSPFACGSPDATVDPLQPRCNLQAMPPMVAR